MAGQNTANAHSVLQYLISRALLQGKTGSSKIQIPMVDLCGEYDGLNVAQEAADLVLNVSITTAWDDEAGDLVFTDDDEEEVLHEEREEEDDDDNTKQ